MRCDLQSFFSNANSAPPRSVQEPCSSLKHHRHLIHRRIWICERDPSTFSMALLKSITQRWSKMLVDATFSICPTRFAQCLNTLFLDPTTGIWTPAFYVLMSTRTEIHYDHVFNRLTEILGFAWEPSLVVSDCEKFIFLHLVQSCWIFFLKKRALLNCIKSQFPNSKQQTCWFHFKQDNVRKMDRSQIPPEDQKILLKDLDFLSRLNYNQVKSGVAWLERKHALTYARRRKQIMQGLAPPSSDLIPGKLPKSPPTFFPGWAAEKQLPIDWSPRNKKKKPTAKQENKKTKKKFSWSPTKWSSWLHPQTQKKNWGGIRRDFFRLLRRRRWRWRWRRRRERFQLRSFQSSFSKVGGKRSTSISRIHLWCWFPREDCPWWWGLFVSHGDWSADFPATNFFSHLFTTLGTLRWLVGGKSDFSKRRCRTCRLLWNRLLWILGKLLRSNLIWWMGRSFVPCCSFWDSGNGHLDSTINFENADPHHHKWKKEDKASWNEVQPPSPPSSNPSKLGIPWTPQESEEETTATETFPPSSPPSFLNQWETIFFQTAIVFRSTLGEIFHFHLKLANDHDQRILPAPPFLFFFIFSFRSLPPLWPKI